MGGGRMVAALLGKQSNLQRLIDRTTPSVQSQSLPKTSFRDVRTLWPPTGDHMVDFFTLEDLWDQYYEWSVCGLGVPVVLDNDETIVQYYVPYLSAIQLYTSKSLAAYRTAGEDSESDSWSDDSESEKQSQSWDAVSEDLGFDQDVPWPARDRIGHLYLQYIERSAPCGRIPLGNKVRELARSYPGLTSFKSVEISPASWMSVAWYPIYPIPARRNPKDLSACFLTYHTISSSFQDNLPSDDENNMYCTKSAKGGRSKEAKNCVSLRPFGLSAYKMQGDLWINPETDDHETMVNLFSAADSWLKQLRVHHHDFTFFLTRTM